MDREKQIEKMANDLNDCITEFVTDVGDVYIDDEATAQKMFDKGYCKQSEIIAEFSEAVKHIAEGVKFKNDTEKTAFIEMLDDLTRVKLKGGTE